MRHTSLCTLFGTLLVASGAIHGSIIFNNITDSPYVDSQLTETLYQSFSSGSGNLVFDDLKLLLGQKTQDGLSFTVNLYADNSNKPGTLLLTIATVYDNSLPSTPAVQDFSVPNYLLTANTQYWIGLIPSNSTIDGSWDGAHVVGGDVGTSGQYVDLGGNVYPSNTNFAYQMTIDVTTASSGAPEPSSGLLLAAGLAAAWLIKRIR